MDAGIEVGVRFEGVYKTFEQHRALNGVDLDVPEGSYTAVMGANGAGKTTLLRMIAGLIAPTKGKVTIAGIEARRAGARLKSLVGYVSHESMLYMDLTTRENLEFNARLFGLKDPAGAVERAVTLTNVERALDRPVRVLSRGTRQRVALARAFLHDPAILLMDEPYAGLDEAASAGLSEFLMQHHTPQRVILVTVHEVSRALDGPERLVALDGGKVVLDMNTDGGDGDVGDRYMSLLRSGSA
jgi:heme ABC exporter ATP-binding subunit CcmA